jgi:DNA polymerase (family 10)
MQFPTSSRTNSHVAAMLREAADLLSAQAADPFRVAAYRKAADRIDGLDRDVGALALAGGADALDAIPGIGTSIASAILQMVRDGRWPYLDHLRGTTDPVEVLKTVPGLGPTLARRIHETLGVDTLQDLEIAAHSGRLGTVPGIGRRRADMIGASLRDALSRIRMGPKSLSREPDVRQILDVDWQYRKDGVAGILPRIAPKRFNPTGEAWLPILHTARGDWSFTALYSNTARAHDLHREHDWVVVYFHTDHGPDGQRTVVTENRGPLAGRRVVRGREDECLLAYGNPQEPS